MIVSSLINKRMKKYTSHEFRAEVRQFIDAEVRDMAKRVVAKKITK